MRNEHFSVAQQVRAGGPIPRVGEPEMVGRFGEGRPVAVTCPRHHSGQPLVVAQRHPRADVRIMDGRPLTHVDATLPGSALD
jgi:hypothetical protein